MLAEKKWENFQEQGYERNELGMMLGKWTGRIFFNAGLLY
jgi:hypothetical protein